MSAPTIRIQKTVSFRCGDCSGPAKITVDDEEPRTIMRVFCPACDSEVEGEEAQQMYVHPFGKTVIQEGSNIARQKINESGLGRIPLEGADTEFSDEQWPFVLVATESVADQAPAPDSA